MLARLVYDESIDEETYGLRLVARRGGAISSPTPARFLIEEHAPAFPVDQMAPIDRTILRIALYELVFTSSVPVKVSINEAVELAKTFGGTGTPRLVNGVLGSVVAKQQQQEGQQETP